MQQTEKYKLNLIEPSDPFLPEGLNANTQKIEAAMIAHEEGIEQRLVALESLKIAFGSVEQAVQVGREWVVELGFAPKIVLCTNSVGFAMLTPTDSQTMVDFRENGFAIVNGQGLKSFLVLG